MNEKEIELIEIASSATMVNSRPPRFLKFLSPCLLGAPSPIIANIFCLPDLENVHSPCLLDAFLPFLFLKISTLPYYWNLPVY